MLQLLHALARQGLGGGEPLEIARDVWVRRECGRADALGLSLGLELEVSELHLGLVDGVRGVVALRGQLADLGVELAEPGRELSERG